MLSIDCLGMWDLRLGSTYTLMLTCVLQFREEEEEVVVVLVDFQ